MQRDEQPRHQGGQRELDHHHAVERRGHQHDDAAERRLHEAEAYDLEPAECPAPLRTGPHHGPPTSGAQREGRGQHADHVERRPGAVVPGRALARALEETRHQRELAGEQQADEPGVPDPVPRREQRDDDHLRHGHHDAGEAGCVVGAHLHGQGEQPHAPVALHRLEIVERHDAVRTDRIEQCDHQDAPVRERGRHHGRTGEPGQALVAERHRRVAPPPVLLQPQRRRRVDPGQDQPEQGRAEDPGPERRGDRQRQEGPGEGEVEAPAARDAPRRDRPSGLVDRVDVAIEPVVRRLARGADQRPGEQNPRRDHRPLTVRRLAGRDHAAGERPHRPQTT